MWMKLAHATRITGIGLIAAAIALPGSAWAQEEADDEGVSDEPADGPAPSAQAAPEPKPVAAPVPPPPPPPAAPPSPFSLSVQGFVSGSVMLQDTPTYSGNGNTTLFGGALGVTNDKWFWGGDVRQSQLKFFITGPELIGAIPTAGFDFDLLGGNQIQNVTLATQPTFPVVDAAGMPVGNARVPLTNSQQGDENILPRVRLAYLELKWGGGTDIIRIGQYHNLIVPMIAASGSHIGAPLGYGAGQLGWRAPGITYEHRFMLSETTALMAAIQVNRNNWNDQISTCSTGQTALNDCLPQGVSLGEASALPQVQARLLISGPPKPSPFPMYAPNAWQLHVVGVWDVKDLSGVGATHPANVRDTLTTLVASAGFKFSAGPLLFAGHGWYGKNAGSMFGHVMQTQPAAIPVAGMPGVYQSTPDINGFGAWGQVGLNLTPQLAVWGFGGIDKPNENDIKAAFPFGARRMQNVQLAGMLSFVAGPLVFALEYMRVVTDFNVRAPTAMGITEAPQTTSANQLALSGLMFFR